MGQRRRDKKRVTTIQKISLIVLGIVLAILFLEFGMRVCGWVMVSWQEGKNRQALRQGGTYRILCLGESTTWNSYPGFLQTRLNQADIGTKFTVIDGGRVSTNTGVILAELEADIARYRPNLVVAMMGINDYAAFLPPPSSSGPKPTNFLTNLRVYKLLSFLKMHLQARWLEWFPREAVRPEVLPPEERPLPSPEQCREQLDRCCLMHVGRAQGCLAQGKPQEAEKTLERVLTLNPDCPAASQELSAFYEINHQPDMAEKVLRQSITAKPDDKKRYIALARFFVRQKKYEKALQVFSEAHQRDQNDGTILVEKAAVYVQLGRKAEAVETALLATTVDPQNDLTFLTAGEVYRRFGEFKKARSMLQQALALNSQRSKTYFELGMVEYLSCRYAKAEPLFQRAYELEKFRGPVLDMLVKTYNMLGKRQKAYQLYQELLPTLAGERRPIKQSVPQKIRNKKGFDAFLHQFWQGQTSVVYKKEYHPAAVRNYRRMREILSQKGIPLICVQYPIRPLKYLQEVFPDPAGVIFVDNEETFKSAILKDGYHTYFTDLFAGDFGHTTPAGSQLLADNIAKVILREVFQRKN